MRLWAALAFAALVAGCAAPRDGGRDAAYDPGNDPGFGLGDGPPRQSGSAVDLARIPNAVPRHEPRSRYGNPPSYVVAGQRYYVLDSAKGFVERGIASWYGQKFHGRRTSSGEDYDMYAMTAAHKSLPLPTFVRVTNLRNGRQVIVKVNDRGPFLRGRIIDLSYAAAAKLGMLGEGTAPVEIQVVTAGESPSASTMAAAAQPAVDVRYFLQVGAFSDAANAERLRQRLSARLGAPVQVETARLATGTFYRVRLGPLSSVREVDQLTTRLETLGVMNSHLVVEN